MGGGSFHRSFLDVSWKVSGPASHLITTNYSITIDLKKKKKALSFILIVHLQKRPTHVQLVYQGRRKEEEGMVDC